MTRPLRNQRTIARPVSVAGQGYWSGLQITVEFRPAAVDSGYVFVRRDVAGCPRIPARVAHRIDVPRRTTLAVDGTSVDMVEHVLSALSGLWIDNCEIWVDRAEMPGCDGSSQAFVDALLQAGLVEQAALRPQLVVQNPTRVGDDEQWIQAEPIGGSAFELDFRLDYPKHPVIGQQSISLPVTPETYVNELASARTFLLAEEAERIRQQGLGSRVSYQDLLVFGDAGPLENTLRFDDECVRHKALDVVGDFALAPFDIVGKITAFRSGHLLNAEMVKQLLLEGSIVRSYKKSA